LIFCKANNLLILRRVSSSNLYIIGRCRLFLEAFLLIPS
jgi:hypothetical protein